MSFFYDIQFQLFFSLQKAVEVQILVPSLRLGSFGTK